MIHPEVPNSPWPFYEDKSSTSEFDQLLVEHYGFQVDSHVGSLFSISQDTTTSNISSITPSSPLMFNNEHFQWTDPTQTCLFGVQLVSDASDLNQNNNYHFHYPIEEDTLQVPSLMDYVFMELDDDFNPNLGAQQVLGTMESSEGSFPSQNWSRSSDEGEYAWSPTPSMKSDLTSTTQQPSLILPQEGMTIDNKVVLPHMLVSCGEAHGQGHKAQAEAILSCLGQKVSPIAHDPLERLAFYLSQEITNQGDYLKQEANKIFEAAFKGFYQGTPHGKFAHFVANSAILEAVPRDCEVIHIVDFDMGQGVQFPPMIEAIAKMNKTLKLTSIKWGEEIYECNSQQGDFDETKRKLYEHAKSCNLKLKVEEKGIEEVVVEIKKLNKRGGRKEFLAFNCMMGLPHMGKERSSTRKHVMEFLNLINSILCGGNRGIVTFGDGGVCEKLRNGFDFKSFFDGNLVHYKALLESIESHFPTSFLETRVAMECLFVAPNISSFDWLQKWEEMREGCNVQAENGLGGCRLSKEILMEVKEMLKGSGGSYEAKIEGQNGNELVLEWRGVQLVRVSTWRN